MHRFIRAALIGALSTLTACASIIEGSHDKINISTNPPSSASCSASNSLGNGSGYTPGTITGLKKSKTNLEVRCVDNATGAQGSKSVESEFDFLTILGGLIGLSVDAGTGAMWDYPQDVTVPLVGAAPQAAAPAQQYYAPAPGYAPAPAQQPAPSPYYTPQR